MEHMVYIKTSSYGLTLKSIDAKFSANMSFLWFSCGLFITASVILSSTCSICSLESKQDGGDGDSSNNKKWD